jgi:hypothetical protein
MQIINAIIVYGWLFAVLFFLWRHAMGAGARTHQMVTLLAESNRKSAEAAQEAAQAALQLAELLRKRDV